MEYWYYLNVSHKKKLKYTINTGKYEEVDVLLIQKSLVKSRKLENII